MNTDQTSLTSIFEKYIWVSILLVVSLFPFWVAFRHWQFLNDDTYITLTYAKSLALGRGFVFNHPPATLGTTAPLLALIVAGLAVALPGIEISQIAVGFTAVCWLSIAWAIYLARRTLELSRWQAVTVGVFVIASGQLWTLGMEHYLFEFLLVLAVILYLRQRWLLTGLAVGLLFLTRGEGILLLPMMLAHRVGRALLSEEEIRRKEVQHALGLLAGTSVVILVWTLYAGLTFGRILPNTLWAKMAQGHFTNQRAFLPVLVNDWMPQWGSQFRLPNLPPLGYAWWGLAAIGFVYLFVHKRRWILMVVWIIFYIMGYSILRVPPYYWYQMPILFVVQVLVALGTVAVIDQIVSMVRGRTLLRSLVTGLFGVAIASALFWPRVKWDQDYTGDHRAPAYLTLAEWLQENTLPSESVAYYEIGYLGYYTDNRIVDLMGLTIPEIVPHMVKEDFTWGFWRYMPDYFIYTTDADGWLGSIRYDSRFDQMYQAVTRVTRSSGSDLVVFAKVGAEARAER